MLSVGATEVKAGPQSFRSRGKVGRGKVDGPLWTVGTTRSVGVLLFGPREVFCGADRAAFSYLLPGILSYPRYTTGHREAPMDPRNYHHHHRYHYHRSSNNNINSTALLCIVPFSSLSFLLSFSVKIVDAKGTVPRVENILLVFTEGSRGKFHGREGTHGGVIANRGSKLILDPGIRLVRFDVNAALIKRDRTAVSIPALRNYDPLFPPPVFPFDLASSYSLRGI